MTTVMARSSVLTRRTVLPARSVLTSLPARGVLSSLPARGVLSSLAGGRDRGVIGSGRGALLNAGEMGGTDKVSSGRSALS